MVKRTLSLLGCVVVAVGAAQILAFSAAGASDTLVIPITTVVRAEPGSVVEVGRMDVDPDLVGATCDWSITAHNQESVHPGNNLVVASGGEISTIEGVEDVPGAVASQSRSIVLGETIIVNLVMGSDGVFSAGIDVSFACGAVEAEGEESTTTTSETVTTTEPQVTTSAVPSTTEVTTTTMADATTTVGPESTTTTAAATTSAPSRTDGGDVDAQDDQSSDAELPATGATTQSAIALAVALISIGAIAAVAARRITVADI